MTITLRQTKGVELTHAELDGNFTDLDARKANAADLGPLASAPIVTPELLSRQYVPLADALTHTFVTTLPADHGTAPFDHVIWYVVEP